jgi:PilZ domain
VLQNCAEWNVSTDHRHHNLLQRARRFPTRIPIRYSPDGGSTWFEGQTEDISHSGVLFVAEQAVPIKTDLTMKLSVSSAGTETVAEIVCRGNIVRIVQADGTGTLPRLGVTISSYQITRRSVSSQPAQSEGVVKDNQVT